MLTVDELKASTVPSGNQDEVTSSPLQSGGAGATLTQENEVSDAASGELDFYRRRQRVTLRDFIRANRELLARQSAALAAANKRGKELREDINIRKRITEEACNQHERKEAKLQEQLAAANKTIVRCLEKSNGPAGRHEGGRAKMTNEQAVKLLQRKRGTLADSLADPAIVPQLHRANVLTIEALDAAIAALTAGSEAQVCLERLDALAGEFVVLAKRGERFDIWCYGNEADVLGSGPTLIAAVAEAANEK